VHASGIKEVLEHFMATRGHPIGLIACANEKLATRAAAPMEKGCADTVETNIPAAPGKQRESLLRSLGTMGI